MPIPGALAGELLVPLGLVLGVSGHLEPSAAAAEREEVREGSYAGGRRLRRG